MKMTATCNQTNQESFSYENPRPVETKLCNIGPESKANTTNSSYSRLVKCPLQHLGDASAELLPNLI